MSPIEQTRHAQTENEGTECTSLVPFQKDLVPVVDLGKGLIQIDPPEGLLDLVTKGPWAISAPRRGRVDKRPLPPG